MLRISRPLLSLPARAAEKRAASTFASTRSPTRPISAPSTTANYPKHIGHSTWVRRAQYSTKIPVGRDKQAEKEVAGQKLEADPENVTPDSSIRKVWEPSEQPPSDDAMKQGLATELQTVKDTFDLSSVPPLPYKLGLAGTLPYLGTSLSTLYLSWNLNTKWPTSSTILDSLLLRDPTAQNLLQHLEPIQLGYGAVIISFLGAIHWGLEYAETKPNPKRTNFRYALGVAAPAVAWPTLLMPVEHALIAQFAAFVGLYFFDVNASRRGWAPPWYGTYRFVLTSIVGSAIVLSLLGRARIGEGGTAEAAERISDSKHGRLTREMPEAQWRRLEAEEKERIQKEKEEEAERKKQEEEEKQKQEKKREEKVNKSEKGDRSDKGNKNDKGDKGKAKGQKVKESPHGKEQPESDKDESGQEKKEGQTQEDGTDKDGKKGGNEAETNA